jgi:hypothetical protein
MIETNSTRIALPYWANEILRDKRHDRFVVTGGLGCLRGDVKIQTINGLVPIADLSSPTHVLSWDEKNNQFCYRLASASFQKGKGYLFRVSTTLGEFVANGYHRLLLASNDYQQVDRLAVGDVVSYCHSPSLTTKAHALLKFLSSDHHLSQKALDLICHCLSKSRLCDPRPQQVQDIALDASPLLTDALKQPHICDLSFSFDKGDLLEQSHEHNQVGQSCDHSCMLDYVCQLLELEGVEANQASTLFFERALLASPELKQSLLMFLSHHKEELINFDHKSSCLLRSLFESPSVCMSEAPIVALEPLDSNEAYYDLSVEGTHNYITEDGTIHHNSSKTTNGLLTFFINILNNPLAKMWWVIAPTHSRIDDSVIPASVFALDLMGLKSNIHYKLVRSKPATVRIHSTGQEIRFISADRPDLMVSATLGGYFITEAFRIKREVYENVESRARSVNVDRILGILEGTPEGDTWGKDEFDIDRSDPVRKLRRFILHTYDNEHNLHPSYIPRLHQIYAHNPAQIRSYIYGEFSNFRSGDVFGQYVESRNVIPDVEADPMRDINICFDFNASPLTWTAWQKIPYRIGATSRLREICIAESSLKLTDLFQACVEIGQAFPSSIFADTKINIWGDRTGHAKSHKAKGTDFDNIKKYLVELYKDVEIKAPTQITPIRASVDVLNRMFLYELILVCESCKNLRRSYNNTKWSDKKTKVDLDKPAGETHTHHGDGTRYRLWWEYKSADINTLASQNITGINLV